MEITKSEGVTAMPAMPAMPSILDAKLGRPPELTGLRPPPRDERRS